MNITQQTMLNTIVKAWKVAYRSEYNQWRMVRSTIDTIQDLVIYSDGSEKFNDDLQFLWMLAFQRSDMWYYQEAA